MKLYINVNDPLGRELVCTFCGGTGAAVGAAAGAGASNQDGSATDGSGATC